MKLYYLFLLVMYFLMGCSNSHNVSGPDVIGQAKMLGDLYRYTIDGHEYIQISYGIAHSGSCKKCEKELEDIICKVIREEK